MLTFGFATMISVKRPKAKKGIFVVFYHVKNGQFCSFPNSTDDICKKLTFLRLLDIPI